MFKFLVYRATPEIGGGELIAGFREREDAFKYLEYLKLLEDDGSRYYMKENPQQVNT